MRVTCNKCLAVYEIDNSLIPQQGKKVRCSNCGDIFVCYPEEEIISTAVEEVVEEVAFENIVSDENIESEVTQDVDVVKNANENDEEYIKNMVKKEKIKVPLDFHGMAAHREQDICIGIYSGKNIYENYDVVDYMVNVFHKYGFKNVTIDVPFNAGYEYCVSRYIAKECNIPTFQIEINLKYRLAKYKGYEKYKDLLKSFEEILKFIIEKINKQ